jgi:hypothetical protein
MSKENIIRYFYLVYSIDEICKFFRLHDDWFSMNQLPAMILHLKPHRDENKFSRTSQVQFYITWTQNSHFIAQWLVAPTVRQSNHSSKQTHFRRHLKQKKNGVISLNSKKFSTLFSCLNKRRRKTFKAPVIWDNKSVPRRAARASSASRVSDRLHRLTSISRLSMFSNT